jgi:hypothetical protein
LQQTKKRKQFETIYGCVRVNTRYSICSCRALHDAFRAWDITDVLPVVSAIRIPAIRVHNNRIRHTILLHGHLQLDYVIALAILCPVLGDSRTRAVVNRRVGNLRLRILHAKALKDIP